ncbi:secondary thiamine-phosphate synthase enzyme YjbQ [Lentisalinibacter sediminis]|uniref:secondary thiamine-phosphate synthase enzyme YjbQ n=1 Tax=Lentisalinibacter sediminis TaxID=2992237 RepID=UPI003865DFFB
MFRQKTIEFRTSGRETLDITREVESAVAESGIETGLAHLFLRHTSASIMLCENADPAVREDLERFMQRIAPDGDPMFRHRSEGPDDMPAHVRTVLTQSEMTLPVGGGNLLLGTWQGIYLWEHRHAGHRRQLTVTVYGE